MQSRPKPFPHDVVDALDLVRLRQRLVHRLAEGIVSAALARGAEHGEVFGQEAFLRELIDRRHQLAPGQVTHRAHDDHRAWVRAHALRDRDRDARPDGDASRHFFTACPPNSLRSAAMTLPEYVSSCRDRNRISSESVMTGAGTSRSIASCTVQRPSPESETKPFNP